MNVESPIIDNYSENVVVDLTSMATNEETPEQQVARHVKLGQEEWNALHNLARGVVQIYDIEFPCDIQVWEKFSYPIYS